MDQSDWKILVVGQDEGVYGFIRQLLAENGNYQVDRAMTGEEARRMLLESRYDALLVEEVSGEAQIAELRRAGSEDDVHLPPILLVSDKGSQAEGEALSLEQMATSLQLLERLVRISIERHQAVNHLVETQARLKATEKRYQELIRYAPAAIYEVDFRGQRFITVNEAMCEMTGYSREELLTMRPFDLLDQEGQVLFQERIQSWIAGEEPEKNVEYKVKAKDGHILHALLNTTFSKDEEGKPLGATVVGFDISERKRAEEALRASQKYISRLVETSYEGIWSVDRSGTTTFVNPRAAEILGYTVEEIRDKNAFQLLMAGKKMAGRQTLAKILAGESGRVEAYARRKDGCEAVLLVSYSPVFNEEGDFQGALAMFTDITERKQAELALEETSEQLREYSGLLAGRVRERTEELVNLQRRLVDSVEAERLHVSQELHDGPMQEIYGLIYKISLLRNVGDDDTVQAEINSIVEKLKEINVDLRSINRELRPVSLTPLGLEKAIREHSERFDLEHPGLQISLHLMEDQTLLAEHVRLCLFRIYQTALANVIRHSQARNVSVKFWFDEEKVFLEIQDDGKGFEVPKRLQKLAAQGHYGLAGAADRAEAIGGILEVASAPGQGTLLRVIAPLKSEEASPTFISQAGD